MEEQASEAQINFMNNLKCSYPDKVTKQEANKILKDALERKNGVSEHKPQQSMAVTVIGDKTKSSSYPKDPVGLAVELMIGGFPKEDISSEQSKDLMDICIKLVKQAQKEFS